MHRFRRAQRFFLWSSFAGAVLATLRAEVAPAALFSDGAVLQRDKPLPVWGKADPGEKVTVTFGAQQRSTVADREGGWMVFLDAVPASRESAELTIAGKNTLVLRDIVVGEVWLCSGQSNMEWPVSRAANAVAEIAAAQLPLVRHVKIDHAVATSPAGSVKTSGWHAATSPSVGAFTAVGYYFARELQQRLGIPIGLIQASCGGSPIEAWMSAAALASNPAFAVVSERWQKAVADYPAARAAYDVWLAEWTKAEAAAKAQGDAAHHAWLAKHPGRHGPRGAPGDSWMPTGLFNGMIHPLLPYAWRGVLWYQGESNTDRPAEYHALFATLITAWRFHFSQGDVPFYWVNLANYHAPDDPSGMTYAFLREAQTKALALPNTGQALAIDIGDPNNIHPANKQEVGRRLALLARKRVYGITTDDSGPAFVRASREVLPARGGVALRVRFSEVESGLVAHGKPPQSLELAGENRVFHPATGRIEHGTLLVSSPAVPQPVAVRYAWRNAPEANLYNGAGLPAVPFRSDDW